MTITWSVLGRPRQIEPGLSLFRQARHAPAQMPVETRRTSVRGGGEPYTVEPLFPEPGDGCV